MKQAWTVLLALVVLSGDAWGETYRWIDSRGEMHFTDNLASVPKQYRQQAATGDDITLEDPDVRASVANDRRRAAAVREEEARKEWVREQEYQNEVYVRREAEARARWQREREAERERQARARRREHFQSVKNKALGRSRRQTEQDDDD